MDARSLLYAADLVLGAGGTMTREAALLGVPTVSLFAGPTPAVDRWLEARGALSRATCAGELPPLRKRPSEPRPIEELRTRGEQLVSRFVELVLPRAEPAPGRPEPAPEAVG